MVEERLDRFLSCKNWRKVFQENVAIHLTTWTSDHNLVMMDVVEKTKEVSITEGFLRASITKTCGVHMRGVKRL